MRLLVEIEAEVCLQTDFLLTLMDFFAFAFLTDLKCSIIDPMDPIFMFFFFRKLLNVLIALNISLSSEKDCNLSKIFLIC